MNNAETNGAVRTAVNTVLFWAMYVAVEDAVYVAVEDAVCIAVNMPMRSEAVRIP